MEKHNITFMEAVEQAIRPYFSFKALIRDLKAGKQKAIKPAAAALDLLRKALEEHIYWDNDF